MSQQVPSNRCTARWRATRSSALGALALVLGTSQALSAPPPARAVPPKFGKSETDLFFPDAREKLVGPRPKRSVQEQVPTKPVATEKPASGSSAENRRWSTLIDGEVVENEIKAQQLKLSDDVQSAARFKGGGYRKAREHLSLLAVLFAIDDEYGQPMRWQREARTMRDRLTRSGLNCKVGTDNSYHDAKARSEEVETLVRGGAIDASAAAASDEQSARLADRAPLMQRLEEAQQQVLTPWTAAAGEFTRHGDKLAHEAQLVAALAEVIARPGYEFADDDTYQEYARQMQQQAIALRQAIDEKRYEPARRAVGEIAKACANCHEGYRN